MTSLAGSCRFSIVILCPIPVPVPVLFPIPVPFPVSGFLIFQTPIKSLLQFKDYQASQWQSSPYTQSYLFIES